MNVHDPIFGCLLAQGRTDRDGYAWHGKSRAHQVAWERANGPVPEGMEIEHECRRRNCCRVAHLRLVTHSENVKRQTWRNRVKVLFCKDGHDMKLNVMVTPEGGRVCRTCSRSDKP